MHIYHIVLNDTHSETGHRLFMNFRTETRTLEDLHYEFQKDGVILGERLFTSRDRDTATLVRISGGTPVIVGKNAVYTIELPTRDFVSDEHRGR
jgi:uncharacterized Fe-S cluster-containing radical SAM superfamily protein